MLDSRLPPRAALLARPCSSWPTPSPAQRAPPRRPPTLNSVVGRWRGSTDAGAAMSTSATSASSGAAARRHAWSASARRCTRASCRATSTCASRRAPTASTTWRCPRDKKETAFKLILDHHRRQGHDLHLLQPRARFSAADRLPPRHRRLALRDGRGQDQRRGQAGDLSDAAHRLRERRVHPQIAWTSRPRPPSPISSACSPAGKRWRAAALLARQRAPEGGQCRRGRRRTCGAPSRSTRATRRHGRRWAGRWPKTVSREDALAAYREGIAVAATQGRQAGGQGNAGVRAADRARARRRAGRGRLSVGSASAPLTRCACGARAPRRRGWRAHPRARCRHCRRGP